jgi:uncharacterized protein (TIGR02217 family)
MAWDSTKTQKWDVIIKKSGSKKRKTMTTQAYPEWVIKCAYTCLDVDEIEQLAGFFAKVKGQLSPFLWKDFEDYKQENVRIGTGNGVNKDFQLLRNYADEYVEPIYDVVPGTLTVYVGEVSVPYTLGTDGLVTLDTEPEIGSPVTATFEYYWRVAFDDDITWENFWYGYYKLNTITLVSAR